MTYEDLKKKRMLSRKDKIRYNILTVLLGEYETKLKGSNPKDADVVSIAKKFIKNNKEVLAIKEDETLLEEIKVLEEFLPKQLTGAELSAIIAEADKDSLGDIMKYLNQSFKGQFDSKTASELAKEFISYKKQKAVKGSYYECH